MLVTLLVICLVAAPAMVGFLVARHPWLTRFRPGAPIVYRVMEVSDCPSREAREVFPSEHGDSYYYLTEKYWRVEEVHPDGWIVALTPLMEHHYLRRDDPNLRKASLVERLRYGARFPYPA